MKMGDWFIMALLFVAVVYDPRNVPVGCLALALALACSQLYTAIKKIEDRMAIGGDV